MIWTDHITFVVYGPPVPQPRPRFVAGQKKTWQSNRVTKYREALAWAGLKARRDHGGWNTANEYRLDIDVFESFTQQAGDWDIYGKLVCDALQTVLWDNDKQVTTGHVTIYRKTEEPRLVVLARRKT